MHGIEDCIVKKGYGPSGAGQQHEPEFGAVIIWDMPSRPGE